MTTNKISPRARSSLRRADKRAFNRSTGVYPDGAVDITHLPTRALDGILRQQFPEAMRDKIYFVLVNVEDPESGDYELWAEASTYEGRTVYAGVLLDEPVEYERSAADMITVRRAKVTDEFIAAVALML